MDKAGMVSVAGGGWCGWWWLVVAGVASGGWFGWGVRCGRSGRTGVVELVLLVIFRGGYFHVVGNCQNQHTPNQPSTSTHHTSEQLDSSDHSSCRWLQQRVSTAA